jgi:hypothetical protein
MTQYTLQIKKLDYDTYISPDIRQNHVMNEIFEWSETKLNL